MPHYPQSAVGLNYIGYPVGPNSRALQVPANAAANTKGAYTEFIASSPFACNSLVVFIQNPELGTAGACWLVDIATGAAAAEVVVIPDLLASNGGGFNAQGQFEIPLAIAASTRITGRCQCTQGGNDIFVGIELVAAGDTPGCASYTNYGANAADSGGVAVDPGGSADTKGAYSQITGSTAAVIQSLVLSFGIGANSAPQTAIWSVDLATGAAAAEVVLISDMKISGVLGPMRNSGVPFLTYIPAGTRVAMRASCNITDATDRLFDIAMLGSVAPAEPSGTGGGSFAHA